MKQTLNYTVIGRAGIAWSIIQLFSNLLFLFVTTPAFLLFQKFETLFRSSWGWYFILVLVLTLLIVVLTIGTYKKKAFFAFTLLGSVVLWVAVAIYGLVFKNTIMSQAAQYASAFVAVNIVYFGIMAIILLFISIGIWNQPPRRYRVYIIPTAIVLLIVVPIIVPIGVSKYNQSGSISGNIYQSNGTIIDTEVRVNCQAVDRNVFITRGDPAPPYLVINTTGKYKIENLPEGDYYLWVVDTDDNLSSNGFYLVSVNRLHKSKLDFNLVQGGSISGSFLDDHENAVPDAGGNTWVVMYCTGPISWSYSIKVNSDGTYSKMGLLPAEYNIYFYPNLNQSRPIDKVIIENGMETHHDFFIFR